MCARLRTILVLLIAGCWNQPERAKSRAPSVQPVKDEAQVSKVRETHEFRWRTTAGAITDLHFTPNDSKIVVLVAPANGTYKRLVHLLSVANGNEEYRIEILLPQAICVSRNGSLVATLTNNTLNVDHIREGQASRLVSRKVVADIRALGFSGDSSVLVGSPDGLDAEEPQVAWDTTTWGGVTPPTGQVFWYGKGLSRDGSLFIAGGWPGATPRIYRTDDRERLTYCYNDKRLTAATFTSDAKEFLAVYEDGELVVWEMKPTGEDNARVLATHPGFGGCRALAVSHDRTHLATAGIDGVVRIRRYPEVGDNPLRR